MNVTESHQEGGVGASLPSAEVCDETCNNERKGHKGDCHSCVRVEIREGSAAVSFGADGRIGLALEAILLVDGPEAPEHGCEGDERTEGCVENHISHPLVAHVASGCDLN